MKFLSLFKSNVQLNLRAIPRFKASIEDLQISKQMLNISQTYMIPVAFPMAFFSLTISILTGTSA